MGVFIIDGMQQLSGEVCVSGGKNAVLPLLAATLLTKEEVTIHNCPMISDVMDMLEILACLGAKTQVSGNTITVCAADICTCAMPEELSHKIRSSIFLLGSMLARKSEACFFAPGGCEIGKRPIDQHIHALGILGVQSETGDGRIICRTHGLKGADIRLRFPSVGATKMRCLQPQWRRALRELKMRQENRRLYAWRR